MIEYGRDGIPFQLDTIVSTTQLKLICAKMNLGGKRRKNVLLLAANTIDHMIEGGKNLLLCHPISLDEKSWNGVGEEGIEREWMVF